MTIVRAGGFGRQLDQKALTTTTDPVTERPYNTTLPLAHSLGLTIQDYCEFDDMACAAKQALKYNGPGNVLIAWEHVRLPTVAKDIGAQNAPKYPGEYIHSAV